MKRSGILHLSPFYLFPENPRLWRPRFDPLGGMHLLTHVMTYELCRRGVQQIVLTMGLPGAPKDYRPQPNLRVISRRYPVLPIRSKLEGYFGLVMAYAAASLYWIWEHRHTLRERIGLVHVHCDGSGSVPWLGRHAARILHAPLVMHIHSCRNLTQVATTPWERVVDPLAKASEMQCISVADRIITLTDRLKALMVAELGLPAAKIERIASMAHRDFRANNSAASRPEITSIARFSAGKPVIAYLGRIAIEKGVDVFVEMARLLSDRDYRYLIIGDGPELDAIRARVDQMGLSERFYYTGFLEPDLVASAIARASVGVVPSRYEEFGLVIAEFMQMGVPVVATDVGGVRELLRHEASGLLVASGDALGLANAVRRLMDDASLRDRLTAEAHAASSDLSVSHGVLSLIELYRAVAPSTMQDIK